jgi:hypothetical protein
VKYIAVLTTVSLFILSHTSWLSGQTSETCSAATLPSATRELLNSKFPLWRAKQISDLGADDQQLWAKAHPKDCPGIAVGHFESSDQVAYAVLLVPKTKSSGGYKIVVLNARQSGSDYSLKILDQEQGPDSDGLVISVAAPGQYSDFDNMNLAKLRVDGIYVEWIEKAAILYYWSSGRYRTLQVSD